MSLAATRTATQCSAALPTIATTIAPMKNSLSPTFFAVSEIELTRISDMPPTATPASASRTTALRTVQGSPRCSSAPASGGLKSARWVRSEKSSTAP